MKTLTTIILTIVTGFILSTTVSASSVHTDLHGAKIDQLVSFYQGRLYLLDSNYEILSGIGENALNMINFLQDKREQLIEGMKSKQVYRAAKIKGYIMNHARKYLSDKEDGNNMYAAKVDQMTSFYLGRLYLLDSEYKILSDIGEDALNMVGFLQNNREQLIEGLKTKGIFQSAKARGYIVNRARMYVASQEKESGELYSKL